MKKILVIEDNKEFRTNLAEILILSGYETITAENGKIGVEKALNEQPDLIICDVSMPGLDGFGTLSIISKNPQTAGIPFIYLSASAEREDIRRGMTLGADDFITKPFDDVTLLQNIERRLQKYDLLKKAADTQTGSLDRFINIARGMEALSHLPENREIRHYNKKDLLFQEGEQPRWLFFIEKGKVKIFNTTEDNRDFITKIAGPGEFIGYLALFQELPYMENAAAMEEVSVKMVPKHDFLSLVYGNRDVTAHFIKILAGHVSEQEKHLLQLAYNSVRKRVALALISLAGGEENDIKMFREDLASIVGTAKETLVRTLADFKSEGLIHIHDGYIHLLEPEKLRSMPN